MQGPKSLRRPSNWQDFETLCKKLWGEIWNCSEIKKNGRTGQEQAGVDIYGIPNGENQYYGIQCKGKDEYVDKQFTEKELTTEIEKAKSFKPSLKKLYFATTASKDVKIECFIRNKNIEHLNNNLFEIHLFSWEDIVDFIDENRQTHDWYLNSQNFKLSQDSKICFDNDLEVVDCIARFSRSFYKRKFGETLGMLSINNFDSLFDYVNLGVNTPKKQPKTYINLSFFSIIIKLHNTGIGIIEDFKLVLDFHDGIKQIAETNLISETSSIKSGASNIIVDTQKNRVTVIPQNAVLVSDDTFYSNKIFIKPTHISDRIIIKWKLLSKDYKNEGTLTINTTINIIGKYEEIDQFNSYPKSEYGIIKDFIISPEDLEDEIW